MAKKKKKKAAVEMTLWDVCLSYPDLHDPKPYKGKIYYRTDCLMDEDHPQLGAVRAAIKKVKVTTWGEDKSEWPQAAKPLIQNGDEREDQKGYAGKKYITASTQTPVPVVNPSGKEFNPQMVKGGMFANVAIRISAWEFDGDEGVSIYLQGVQIDTKKPSLNFGGGKSVAQMFKRDEDAEDGEDTESANDEGEDSDDDEDDQPRSKKKRVTRDEEDEEEESESEEQDDEEEERPKKKKGKKRSFSEEEDEE